MPSESIEPLFIRRCDHCGRPKDGYQFRGQPDPRMSYCKRCCIYLSTELKRTREMGNG